MNNKPLALIIEDHEDQNLIFTEAMFQAGYKTESIMDGDIAKKRLEEVVPAMVILDLNLPGTQGRSLLSQIRNDERMEDVTVILATADSRQADELRSQSDIVLLKPISFPQLSILATRFKNYMKSNKNF